MVCGFGQFYVKSKLRNAAAVSKAHCTSKNLRGKNGEEKVLDASIKNFFVK